MKRAVKYSKEMSPILSKNFDERKFPNCSVFPKNMSQSKCKDQQVIENFPTKCNNVPIKIRRENIRQRTN